MPYAEIYRRLEAQFAVLEAVQTPRLVHWDLWDGNIFVDPQTLRVSGLIDFERALWGDPLIEAVFGDIDGCQHARAGYGEDLLAAPGGRMRRRLYNIYLHLIMVIECTYRRYAAADQENWVRPILESELQALA
jgi:aminoglycoside phosphotransferase (APT) family kinase protein